MARRKNEILDPVGKLFDDPLYLEKEPALIISDTHCPYQNKELLIKAFELAKKQKIKLLIHAGDLIDAGSLNSQAKGEKTTAIETDIEHARSILYVARTYFNKIVLIPGNHDGYYVKKKAVSFRQMIHDVILLNKYPDIFITTEYDYVFYNEFAVIGHPSNYDMTAGKLAAELTYKYNLHALVGHDHLYGAMKGKDNKWGLSIGGMFMPNSFWYKSRSYSVFPHSQLGFVIIKNDRIYHYNDALECIEYGDE
jgi:predicted phosphodiesterase